jgi:serine/threonine-protein kinase
MLHTLRSHLLAPVSLAVLVAACASSGDTSDPGSGDDPLHGHPGCTADAGPPPVGTDAGSSGGGNGGGSGGGSGGGTTPDAGGPGQTPPPADAGSPNPAGGGVFTAVEPWNTRVDSHPKDPASDAIIQSLTNAGGWGTSGFQIDMSIEVMHADASTPLQTFTPTGDFYTPDCDQVPFPVPANGMLEGETGYACTNGGDCHLLVVHDPSKKLYEMWRANIDSSGFSGGCVAVWDLTKQYPSSLRGDGCTSADAGGFPITAMLANADEVAAGNVSHALRFILPNGRIRHLSFVNPGTHTTAATSGDTSAPPYGVRFRLRADYPLSSLPSAGARTLAVALQRYGMFLADGGNVPLTVQGDHFTKHTWASVGVDSQALKAIQSSDFEVVDMPSPITSNPDCTRN